MARTKKTYAACIHGAEGTGATLAEAKADAARRIETAFADDWSYTPEMQRFPRGEIGLMHRALDGWHYSLIWPHDVSKQCYGSGAYASRREAQRCMRRHMAQQYTDHEESQYGLAFLSADDEAGQREHRYYIAWQESARKALAQGMSDTEAHRWACEHTQRSAA